MYEIAIPRNPSPAAGTTAAVHSTATVTLGCAGGVLYRPRRRVSLWAVNYTAINEMLPLLRRGWRKWHPKDAPRLSGRSLPAMT